MPLACGSRRGPTGRSGCRRWPTGSDRRRPPAASRRTLPNPANPCRRSRSPAGFHARTAPTHPACLPRQRPSDYSPTTRCPKTHCPTTGRQEAGRRATAGRSPIADPEAAIFLVRRFDCRTVGHGRCRPRPAIRPRPSRLRSTLPSLGEPSVFPVRLVLADPNLQCSKDRTGQLPGDGPPWSSPLPAHQPGGAIGGAIPATRSRNRPPRRRSTRGIAWVTLY